MKKFKKWSMTASCCKLCKRSDRRHLAKNMCSACYMSERRKDPVLDSREKEKRKLRHTKSYKPKQRKKLNPNWNKEYWEKNKEVIGICRQGKVRFKKGLPTFSCIFQGYKKYLPFSELPVGQKNSKEMQMFLMVKKHFDK